MTGKVFIEFPVRDLAAARAFYLALGFTEDEELGLPDHRVSFTLNDGVSFELLSESRFEGLLAGGISDARQGSQFLVAFLTNDRAEVDAYFDKAIAAGGSPWLPPSETETIYCRSFTDVDGHVLEAVWVKGS